jgi:hypothetical protein
MFVNADKTKIMIINSNHVTYLNYIYDNNMEEVLLYKSLGIDFHSKLNWNVSVERKIVEVGKIIMALSTIVKKLSFGYG